MSIAQVYVDGAFIGYHSNQKRIMQYTIERRTASTPDGSLWCSLSSPKAAIRRSYRTDLQASTSQRDQYVGFRRIDEPIRPAAATANVRAIRFRCLRSLGEAAWRCARSACRGGRGRLPAARSPRYV